MDLNFPFLEFTAQKRSAQSLVMAPTHQLTPNAWLTNHQYQ
jgi:hypothetical protein